MRNAVRGPSETTHAGRLHSATQASVVHAPPSILQITCSRPDLQVGRKNEGIEAMKRPLQVLVIAYLFGTMVTAPLAQLAPEPRWPSFRGIDATGVADTGNPPATWNIEDGQNVAWSTPIPGLGHSSPIVWGDRVFVTSAVMVDEPARPATPAGNAKPAATGNPLEAPVTDNDTPHAWRLYCLDRRNGRVLWERTAHQGIPRIKRHPKTTHASATPATDGVHVVAMMGSQGLYAYDFDGRLLWKQDLGALDVGLVEDPTDQWGPASSPIIHDGHVIVQNDRQTDSFVAAFDVETGKELWRVGRDELPAWSTPVVHPGAEPRLITNSPRFIRGHDPATGRELWRVAADAEVKVVTPVIAGDLIIVTGGWPLGGQPIFGIQAATGEVVWKLERGSTYTTTPLVYQDILYIVGDNGVLAAYEVKSGERLYQRRIARDAGGFSASPVAAAGRLYFTSEDGVVYVARAGKTFELLARNDMPEMCLATPAITGDMLIVRTRGHVYALQS